MSPLVENYEITRIRADLAKAKGKLAASQQGRHMPTTEGIPPAVVAQAHDNNMRIQVAHIARLESELVHTMLGARLWSASDIIARMEAPAPVASPPPPPRAPTNDELLAQLRVELNNLPPEVTTVKQLKELIES